MAPCIFSGPYNLRPALLPPIAMRLHPAFLAARTRRALTILGLVVIGLGAQAQQPQRLELCATCHGPQGVSQNPAFPSLAGQPKVFLENQLVLIREGLRDIPPMKGTLDGLQDPDLTALANHFASLPPPPPAAGPVDAARYQRGKETATSTRCGICHLPDYSGRQQVPRLAGQQERFLLDVMKEYRDHPGPGRDTIMAAALYGITNQQLEDLAHFFAHHGK